MSLSDSDQPSEMDRSALLADADGSLIPTGANRGRDILWSLLFFPLGDGDIF